MVQFLDDVKVTTYELTEEERRIKKHAVLQLRYAMQLRKNMRKEELVKMKKAAAHRPELAPRKRSILPPHWAQKRGMRRKMLTWSALTRA